MKNKYLVIKIHNNSVSNVLTAKNEDEAKDLARGAAENQFGRPLTDEEIDDLNDKLEIYNDEDSDNLYTFSIWIFP